MTTRRDLLMTAAAAGFIVAAPGLSACRKRSSSDPATDLKRLLEGFANELLNEYPENATFLGLEKGSHAKLKAQLTDRSAEGDARRARSCADRLDRLKTLDRKALSGLDAVNYDCVLEAHQLASDGYQRFPYGDNAVLNTLQAESISPYVVSQGTGDFAVVPDLLDSQHHIVVKADADAYLARLGELVEALDGESGRIRRDAGLGVIPPDFILDQTVKQMESYRNRPVADWGMVKSVARRAREMKIPGDYEAQARKICETQLAPAIDRQLAQLKALRPHATHDAGVWKLPDGEAYYGWLLKVATTTDLDAGQVHQMGLDQVKAIGSQMDVLLRGQGLTQGGVGQRMSALVADKRFLFPDTDKGRADLIAYLNGRVAAMREQLPKAFNILPKTDLVIKRVPVEIQAGAPDGYEQDGPIDGSRPASYYINLRSMASWPKFTLPTLTFHEGVPGHVWQGAFVRKLPVIRSLLMFNAYVEGWALYAEQLADELGLYADDPLGKLGYLQSLHFRACRLVIDTGLHAKRWTREQAIKWLIDNNGAPYDQARSEIDRYCAWPGQACGYKIGHSEINRLRDKARGQLGAAFDLKNFDDALLTSGSLPLDVLARVIDDWIATQKA